MSRPARDAWIETSLKECEWLARQTSRPARDAWIETESFATKNAVVAVASRTGRVD